MKGVFAEGSEVLEDTEKGIVPDAAVISACQRVEHYEMAGYGSAREFAKLFGQREVADLLDETLAEEFQYGAGETEPSSTAIDICADTTYK